MNSSLTWPPPEIPPVFDPRVLEALDSRVLFYPCAGKDWQIPLSLFVPQINQFWFVDTAYFSQITPESIELVTKWEGFHLLDVQVSTPNIPEEDWITDQKYNSKPPYIRREWYRHDPSGEIIQVIRHKRRGPTALRKEIQNLAVFFYRGDSSEGGSGTQWLNANPRLRRKNNKPLIYEVLEKLVDEALFVTDGSMCEAGRNPYAELGHFSRDQSIVGPEAYRFAQPFSDLLGNRFECIGYAGERYGPTLIWRVKKPDNSE